MFGHYFGRFLKERGVVTDAEIANISDMTYPRYCERIVEITTLSQTDIERWYSDFKQNYGMSDHDIEALNSGSLERIIPLFTNLDFILRDDEITRYIKTYQADNKMTDAEIFEKISAEGMQKILPGYMLSDPVYYTIFIRSALEAMCEYYFEQMLPYKMTRLHVYDFDFLAMQEIKGSQQILFAISGRDDDLTIIAEKYSGKRFSEMTPLAEDAIREVVNTVSGVIVTEITNRNFSLELQPPQSFRKKVLCSNGFIFRLPVEVEGSTFDLIFCFDNDVRILAAI